MLRKAKVLVVGGGSTGSSILYHLAKDGVTDSILLERGNQIASGQTGRSTALIRTHYSNPAVARMAQSSLKFFQNFEHELSGYSAGFKLTGLLIGADAKAEKGIIENVSMHHQLGIDSRIITPDEARIVEPELDTSSFTSIVHEPNAGYAEPSMTANAFSKVAEERGASVLLNTQVLDIEKSGSAQYSVKTTSGEIIAEKVIIATGVWSKKLLQRLGLSLPIKPVRHPVTIYRRPEEYSGTRPLIFDFPRKMYYKPEGNHLFYAGSVELELDTSSGEVDPDSYNQDVSYEEIEKFTRAATQCLPVMREQGVFQNAYTGLYDVTPDQEPIIDDFSSVGYERLYCLIGLSGHGFKLCPEFGRIMSTLVQQEKFRDYDVSIFKSDRFKKGDLIKSKYELGTIA